VGRYTYQQMIRYSRIWAWWYTSVIPALGRLRQEDHEFQASWTT
jgi:hypothetical protein